MSRWTRRDFLRMGGMSLLGVLVPEPLLRLAGAVPPPWDILPGEMLSGTTSVRGDIPLILGSGKRNEYPAVAARQGRAWAAWVAGERDSEHLVVRQVEPVNPQADDRRLPLARCSRPAVAVAGDKVWVAWVGSAPVTDGQGGAPASESQIRVAMLEPDGWLSIIASMPPAPWVGAPALVLDESSSGFLAWEELGPDAKHFRVMVAPLRRGVFSKAVPAAGGETTDARRPVLGPLDTGRSWLVWDESVGVGASLVKARIINGDATMGAPQALSSQGGLHLAPAAAADPSGRTWVAWYTNAWPDGAIDVPRRVEVVALDREGKVRWPPQPPDMGRESTSTVQGLEFPQIACTSDGRIWLTARASQNFFVTIFDGREWLPFVRLPKDGWGGRGQRVAVVPLGAGEVVTARRDLDDALAQKFRLPNPVTVRVASFAETNRPTPGKKSHVRERIDFEPWGEWHYYFGDLHGHTSLSDGTGDVDEFYLVRRDVYALDFAALTDHDSFVGNTLLPSEWEEIKAITDHFNESGLFVTLFGQEWTSLRVPRGGGHMNVYSIRRDVPLFDHALPEFDTAQKLVEAARRFDAIAVPHHIGWTGVVWEAFEPQVMPLVEIVSVHGAHEFMGNRPLVHRGGMRGYFAQDGLARGLKFGFIGGTDCHGLLWQHGECWKRDPYEGGLACVLAKELTREAIFDALRKRRCYATSGIRMRMVFEINGAPMG
ncbi:MAG: CehA/McbA family metallohydrolase [Candidatus Sumerlaeaceae bacterium]|nr:CehA/McbA family metallohydrolase [Candidatus Sumerlaeaceae bacterium]